MRDKTEFTQTDFAIIKTTNIDCPACLEDIDRCEFCDTQFSFDFKTQKEIAWCESPNRKNIVDACPCYICIPCFKKLPNKQVNE